MPEKLTVHDPRGYPPKVTGKALAPRVETLDGRTLYLVDCLFDNSDAFMGQLDDWFSHTLSNPTNIAFGGPKFNELFAANLGRWHLTRIDLRRRGSPLACHKNGSTA